MAKSHRSTVMKSWGSTTNNMTTDRSPQLSDNSGKTGNEPMINAIWSKEIVAAIERTGLFDGIEVMPANHYPSTPLGICCWIDNIPYPEQRLTLEYPILADVLRIWTTEQLLNHMLAVFSNGIRDFMNTSALNIEIPVLQSVRDSLDPLIDWAAYNNYIGGSNRSEP